MLNHAVFERLSGIANRLTWIAVLPSPRRGRAAKSGPERPRERLGGTEADRQRDGKDRHLGLGGKADGGQLYAPPAQVIAQSFTGPGSEHAVKVIRGKMRNPGERIQIERSIEIAIDVFQYPMQAFGINGSIVLRCHKVLVAYRADRFLDS